MYGPYGVVHKTKTIPVQFPPQHQPWQPGLEWMMVPEPVSEDPEYKSHGRLNGKVAVITGGDSGIGKAAAIAYAKEGADLVIVYLYEHRDAAVTKQRIEELGRRCLAISIDLGYENAADEVIQKTINTYGQIDVLVNNCGEQHVTEGIEEISTHQMLRTFQTNIFSFFYITKAALPHLKNGSSIINTTSITAYSGHEKLIDYSATKGAIASFTRSLSLDMVARGIRVNGVAPGPIWTPLTVASFPPEEVAVFGWETPMKRAAQPFELAPTYVYLASEESRYVTGQIIHVNGGMFRNT